MARTREERLERLTDYAERLSLCFEDVMVDGVTGEVVARRHTSPGKSFRGFFLRDPRDRTVTGYVARNGEARPTPDVRPR